MNRSAAVIGIGVLAIAVIVGVILFLQLPAPDAPPGQARQTAESARAVADREAPPSAVARTEPAPASRTTTAEGPATPTFDVVRVDKKGNVVIAGKADPECIVTVHDGSRVVGTATADRRGDWVIVPGEPLTAGESQLTLSAKCGDAAAVEADRVVVLIVPARETQTAAGPASGQATGQDVLQTAGSGQAQGAGSQAASVQSPGSQAPGSRVSSTQVPSSQTSSVPAMSTPGVPSGDAAGTNSQVAAVPGRDGAQPAESAIAQPAPASDSPLVIAIPRDVSKPAEILQGSRAAADGVAIDSVDYDEQGNVVISGTASPGSTVQVYVDTQIVGRAQVGDDGRWVLAPDAPVGKGAHAIRADLVKPDGAVVARAEIPFVRGEALADLPAGRIVVIRPGDHLWKIARARYGEGTRYTLIYDANRAQISNPDLIYPGQVFVMPRVN